MVVVEVDESRIQDWPSFHAEFKRVMGFPDFYGANMDAWNDCMTDVDQQSGMTQVTVDPGDLLALKVRNSKSLLERCPEQFQALIECAAFVNWRRLDTGDPEVLALVLA